MNMIQQIRSQLTTAMKEKEVIKKEILRVILGEVSMLELRSGKKPTDEDTKKVIKKLVESNNETLKYTNQYDANQTKLLEENNILISLLPKTLSRKEIKETLNNVEFLVSDVKSARNDGQATGIAMKFFKSNEKEVDGTDVAVVVKELRS